MKINYKKFKKKIINFYEKHGRHNLPWRKDQLPYAVLVSEIMLQQTQVDRVIPFFEKWMVDFPDWEALCSAKQSLVLKNWKGLGYNSRALRLHKLAKIVHEDFSGNLPSDFKELQKLPGIGPYTAAAVRNFAFNKWEPLIETNIRRIYIHEFFPNREDVSDKEIMEKVIDLGFEKSPRDWCAALMDYGSTLPKILKKNPNRQSKHYTKQSRFDGSDRQIRAQILDMLLNQKNHKLSIKKIITILGNEGDRYKKILNDLEKENFIQKEKSSYILVD